MKKQTRVPLLLAGSLLCLGALFFPTASVHADDVTYTIKEPVININKEDKTASISVEIQDEVNGINGWTQFTPVKKPDTPQTDGNGNIIITEEGPVQGSFSCPMGVSYDCRLKPRTISYSFSNLQADYTYGIKNIQYKNNSNEKISIPGKILFRLNEGVTEQSVYVKEEEITDPGTDIGTPPGPISEDPFLTEEPSVITNQQGTASGIKFTMQDEKAGIKTINYVLESTKTDPNTGEKTTSSVPKNISRDCDTSSTKSCEEQYAEPFVVEIPYEELEEGAEYRIYNLALIAPDGGDTLVDGEMTFNTTDGIKSNTFKVMGGTSTDQEKTTENDNQTASSNQKVSNPKTLDAMPIALGVLLASFAVAFGLKHNFARR